MIIRSAELKTVCGTAGQLPRTDLPQVAFAGRSNVGKSSLINAVLNRKKLARTSSEPGKTQTINYYLVNEAFYLVDLPGYGYAKVSKTQRRMWGHLMECYFAQKDVRRSVIQLVDIRHDPTALDIQMMQFLRSRGITPVVVATKADKIRRSQLSKQISAVRKGLNLTPDMTLIPFSAQTKAGTEEVWEQIEGFLSMESGAAGDDGRSADPGEDGI